MMHSKYNFQSFACVYIERNRQPKNLKINYTLMTISTVTNELNASLRPRAHLPASIVRIVRINLPTAR